VLDACERCRADGRVRRGTGRVAAGTGRTSGTRSLAGPATGITVVVDLLAAEPDLVLPAGEIVGHEVGERPFGAGLTASRIVAPRTRRARRGRGRSNCADVAV